WYESRHDVPLIRPDELAGDLERTAIAAGFWSLAREAAGPAGAPRRDWARPPQGGGGGRGAKGGLAHPSSPPAAMANVIGAPMPAPGDGGREFDSARWNASQLRRRKEQAPTELAAEMRRGAEQAQAALMGADLAALTGIGPYAGTPLTEAMELML